MSLNLLYPSQLCIGIITMLGLWRVDKKWETFYRMYMCMLHFTFTALLTASMYMSAYLAPNWDQFCLSLYMAVTEAVFMVKGLNVLLLGKQAVNIFEFIKTDNFAIKSDAELNIFRHNHRRFYIMEITYISASLISGALTFVAPVFGDRSKLPYPAAMPFELNSKTYWYAYTFQTIGMVLTCFSHVGIDILQCYILYHISLIYRVLSKRLEQIGTGMNDKCKAEEAERIVMTELTEIIELHKMTRKITLQCEAFVSIPLQVQISLGALQLCFTGYQLLNMSIRNDIARFLGTLDLLLALTFQAFLPCHYATQVTHQAESLNVSLYNSNWIGLTKNCRRTIYLYMEFLKQPTNIRAGKFFHVGYPTFTKIINNAYSCLVILLKMKN